MYLQFFDARESARRSVVGKVNRYTPNHARERIDKGIRQFDNCVESHRSADEDDIRGGGNGQ